MLARIQNSFANALSACKKGGLPKYVIFVFDDDLISFLDYKHSDGLASMLGEWIQWLVKQIQQLLTERMSQLSSKCRKIQPFLYWVTAPSHSYFSKERNSMRMKFNLSLESVVKQEQNMRVIKLKEHWNSTDSHLVINDRITEMGMIAYWKGIDSSFKYNSKRRENFVAKNSVVNAQESSSSSSQSASHVADDRKVARTAPAASQITHLSNQRSRDMNDPMREFFVRRRNYEEPHMGAREDQLNRFHNEDRYSYDRHRNNRFWLPRPRAIRRN